MIDQTQQLRYQQTTRESMKTMRGVNCRMCLQVMQKSEIQGICQCKKNQTSMHQRCLLQLIDKVPLSKQSFNKYYALCNVCHARIYMQTTTKHSFLSWRKVQICGVNRITSILTIILLIIAMLIFAASTFLLKHKNLDPLIGTIGQILFILGVVVAILTIGMFVFTVCMVEDVTVIGIKGGIKLEELRKKMQDKKLLSNQDKKQEVEIKTSFASFQCHDDILQQSA